MRARAIRRLEKEKEKLLSTGEFELLECPEGLNTWRIRFECPEGTIYSGEKYILRFTFEENYPIDSPEVVFDGKTPVHEHVYTNGYICLSTLYDGWKPSMTIDSTVRSIISMLCSAKRKKRPRDNNTTVRETKGQRAKDQHWTFHDDTC